MKIRYVTLLAAIAGLMAACGNDRKVEPGPSLKEAASGKFLMGVALNVRQAAGQDRKSTRLNSSHVKISYAVFCLKKKKKRKKLENKKKERRTRTQERR